MQPEIAQTLQYGTYFFFLLIGVAFGLPIGWLVGFQTRGESIPMLDPDHYGHEESLSSDTHHSSLITHHSPTKEASCQ